MSRHPSPGPSHPQNSTQNPQPPVLSRQKSKSYAIGIAAGAEDVKYQAKYKDLKKKVKEIEDDNDKLQFKVLQAKRSIQRMKLERAILYERLSAVPPSPDVSDRHGLPAINTAPSIASQVYPSRTLSSGHSRQEQREHPSTVEPDHNFVDYIRTHGNPRVAPGPDGRPIPVIDTPMGPGVAPSTHPLSSIHSPRRTSTGPNHELRQLPPLPQLPSVQQLEGTARGHGHPHTSHASPPIHHSHSSSSHEYSRSHSSSRSRVHHTPQLYHSGQPYPEGLPLVQHVLSPPLSERERSRRGDIHDYSSSHSDPHGHGHHQVQHSPHIYSSETRPSGRPHNHQRIGPGTYVNRDEHHDRDRDRDRDRQRDLEKERDQWERNREHVRGRETSSSHMHTPPPVHRSRPPVDRTDYQDHHHSSRMREEQGYYPEPPGPGGYPMPSRSDTPGSGSGSGGSGIGGGDGPDSRTQYYEHERSRSFRLRPVNQPTDDIDFVHEDGRSQPRDHGPSGGGKYHSSEHSRPSLGSRKRHRNDMDVDSDNDVGEGPPGGARLYSTGRLPDDRGSKRYREHLHRGVDNQEDDRMGHP